MLFAILRKGLESGEINRENYDTFLNKLHGLTEEGEFEQMTRDAEASVVKELEVPEIDGIDVPFSLGKDPFAAANLAASIT